MFLRIRESKLSRRYITTTKSIGCGSNVFLVTLYLEKCSSSYDGDVRMMMNELMMERESLGSSIEICQLYTMPLLRRDGHGHCNGMTRETPESPGCVADKTVKYVVWATTTTVTKVWLITWKPHGTAYWTRVTYSSPHICRAVRRAGSQSSQ